VTVGVSSPRWSDVSFGSFSTEAAGCACRSMSALPQSDLLIAWQRNDAKGQCTDAEALANHLVLLFRRKLLSMRGDLKRLRQK
jgi:hypothetical protein